MKMKTKKAAAKRFRFTATGKIRFKRATKRHGLSNKTASQKLALRKGGILMDGDAGLITRCLPYGNNSK